MIGHSMMRLSPIIEKSQEIALMSFDRKNKDLLFQMIIWFIYMNLILIKGRVRTQFHKPLKVMILLNALMP
jgi:phosphate starvation-inducible membrane PsiE